MRLKIYHLALAVVAAVGLSAAGCGLPSAEEVEAARAHNEALKQVPSEWATSADSVPTFMLRARAWIARGEKYYRLRYQTDRKLEAEGRGPAPGDILVEAYDTGPSDAVVAVWVKPKKADDIKFANRAEKSLAYYVRHGRDFETDAAPLRSVSR